MREIRISDTESLEEGQLALMTLKKIDPNERFFVADFNDIQAPIFTKTGSYFGWSSDRSVKFGKGPAKMINGIWIIEEDKDAIENYENLSVDPNLIEMIMIR
jgi:hypothetical protein